MKIKTVWKWMPANNKRNLSKNKLMDHFLREKVLNFQCFFFRDRGIHQNNILHGQEVD
jgi:hypothetical protein